MASGDDRGLVVISASQLAAVQAILNQATAALEDAQRILRELEVEYQTLRNAPVSHSPAEERRFHALHWQRNALQRFVREQTPVIDNLYFPTLDVATPQELVEDARAAAVSDDGTSESGDEAFTELAPAA